MKKILWLGICIFISASIYSQTQQGYVKTKGRLGNNGSVIKGVRLSGATVTVKGRNGVLSGSNGTFTLTLPGSNYYLQNVQKQGYVVTDPDILSHQYAYSKNPLVLVLETQEQQTDDKLAAERKIRHTLQRQLQEKEDEIESLKKQQKLTDEEYRKGLQEIYAQQESNERLISDMAVRYSKMDFDEVDEFSRRISQLVLDGKLFEADSLLNTKGDINTRATVLRQHQEANAQAEQEIKKKQKKLEKTKELAQKELEDLAQDCYSKFEIFKMQHMNDSAAYYIELRAKLDTMNITWQNEAGHFLENYIANYNSAMKYYQRALDVSSKIYGSNGILVASFYNNIGGLYVRMEDFTNGLDYLQKAIDIKLQNTDMGQVNLETSYNNLGSIYAEQGKLNKALEYFIKASESCNVDEKKEPLSGCYNNIGAIYYRQGKYKESIDYFKKALTIRLELFGEMDYRVAVCYRNIASSYSKLSDFTSAFNYAQKALEIDRKVLDERHPNVANSYNNLGHVYENQEKYNEALECYLNALEINNRIYGEQSTRVATNYNNIGMVYSKNGNYQKAEEFLMRALSIEKGIKGESHADVAWVLNNLGGVYMKQGNYPKALEYRKNAITIIKSTLGDNHPTLALCYNNIGGIYMKLADYNKAYEYYEMAYNIFAKRLGEQHKNTQSVKQRLDMAKSKLQ